MKILRANVNGLNLYKDSFNVDFVTLQRVRNDNSEMLYKIAPKIYQNNVHAFVGINASGKTTTLKVMSFLIQLINNQPINSIKSKSILSGVENDKGIVFEVYFYEADNVYKLETTVIQEDVNDDIESRYVIASEKLWSKSIKSIKTKKNLFDFSSKTPIQVRKGDEEFLPDDVSIIISLNKKNNSKIYYKDLVNWTNLNLICVLGEFPQELISFLDPSIEYLKTKLEKEKNDMDIS